jgi:predicted dehydrogenase
MHRLVFLFALFLTASAPAAEPVRVAILGLSHDHVFWVLGRDRAIGDIEIVAVHEPDRQLAEERMQGAGLDASLYYEDLPTLFREAKPEAAVCFGSIRAHHQQTLACAAAGVHVMVEKPLATNLADAQAMADACRRAGVQLLTNYETTWYPAHHLLKQRLDKGDLEDVRRLVFRTGHAGPIEIGCRKPFLNWLLDPVENGGGAVTDFGCYGVNLSTWLLGGERPIAVSCVTKQLKPKLYPDVDDDATITIEYPSAVAVVQASWSWPHPIKETAVYGSGGAAETVGSDRLSWRPLGAEGPEEAPAPALARSASDPFAHLAAVVRGDAEPNELSSVENNLLVVEVLDAARESARTGRRIELPDR